jgi:uncharacterized protein YbbC (DUF1343 family)
MEFGLEVLLNRPSLAKDWGRCGLLCNQASVSKNFKHAIPLLQEMLGERLVMLLGPQHGLVSTVQDNMIETQHGQYKSIPIYSLYSETREPTEEMLHGVDTIVVDLQIVGCRVYTFKSTIRACLEAAKKYNKRVVILDRPNPLGGTHVEGRSLDKNCHSFVGPDAIPMRHALTVAESANLFNREISAELEIIPLQGWKSWELWEKIRRPWVLTSPNLASWDAVVLYPGLVMLEGTNISEGRGTTLPFQLVGAPYIKDPERLVRRIFSFGRQVTAGVFLRPTHFLPLYGKWTNMICYGFQIHVMDPDLVKSYGLALAIMSAIKEECPDDFAWRDPPYEYEFKRKPMTLIIGSENFEKHFDNFKISDPFWNEGVEAFLDNSSPYIIYERERFVVLHLSA